MRRCHRWLVEIQRRIQQCILRVKDSAAVAVICVFESRRLTELFLREKHQRGAAEQVKLLFCFIQLLGNVIYSRAVAQAIFAIDSANSNTVAVWAQRNFDPGRHGALEPSQSS
jgi:hypothetical protein